MGKLKPIYQNNENGGYCVEEVAKNFSDMYPFKKTEYLYDEVTKYVYCTSAESSTPNLFKSKNGKNYKFNSSFFVEVD